MYPLPTALLGLRPACSLRKGAYRLKSAKKRAMSGLSNKEIRFAKIRELTDVRVLRYLDSRQSAVADRIGILEMRE